VTPPRRTRWHLSTRRLTVGLVAFGLVTLAACSSSAADTATVGERTDADPTTTVEPVPSTTRPTTTTTAAPTTTGPTTTAAPVTTTTEPATTTSSTLALPLGIQATQPIEPPLDAYAREPVVEAGRIIVPRLGVDTTMYAGIRMPTLDRGPGHWPGSALPGEVGNVVVAGHRTSANRVFRYLEQLEPGDEIIFEDARGRFVYRATRTEIVDPYTGLWIIEPTDTPTVTLFACHPPGSVRQRIVVFGELVTA
jgi:sortase A